MAIASSKLTHSSSCRLRCRRLVPQIGLVMAIIINTAHAAIFYTPFGPNGEGGTVNGQVFSFGSGGEVFERRAT